jgi:hypothetical protein
MAVFLRRRTLRLFWRTVTFFALIVLGGTGCSSSSGSSSEAPHIQKVAALIPEFTKAHQGTPPANIEELKSWAVQNGKAEDKDFLSTRDMEPYVIAVTGGGKAKKGSNPMVHEAKGKNGMLFMVNSGTGQVSEISHQGLGYMTGGMPVKGPGGRTK